jgi:hypothetical protein
MPLVFSIFWLIPHSPVTSSGIGHTNTESDNDTTSSLLGAAIKSG